MSAISTLDVLGTVGPDGRASLLLVGTLDAATAPQVLRAIEALARDGARSMVIDLADLRFIDTSGIRTLLQASDALGGSVSVRDADGLVRRALRAVTV
jgi:anti-sigma B factor antagonist